MGGFFGAISHKNCIYDVFFGTDYHSHLGTRRAGLAFYDTEKGFQRQIHSIENTPFRTKFDDDMAKFSGNAGIGCISDTDPQPLLVRSHLGMFAISTVGIINNGELLQVASMEDLTTRSAAGVYRYILRPMDRAVELLKTHAADRLQEIGPDYVDLHVTEGAGVGGNGDAKLREHF